MTLDEQARDVLRKNDKGGIRSRPMGFIPTSGTGTAPLPPGDLRRLTLIGGGPNWKP